MASLEDQDSIGNDPVAVTNTYDIQGSEDRSTESSSESEEADTEEQIDTSSELESLKREAPQQEIDDIAVTTIPLASHVSSLEEDNITADPGIEPDQPKHPGSSHKEVDCKECDLIHSAPEPTITQTESVHVDEVVTQGMQDESSEITNEANTPAYANEEAQVAVIPSLQSNQPRLVNPRKPVRKGVKPPTRGAPIAFKLTTKTDTDNIQAPPQVVQAPPQVVQAKASASSSALDISVPVSIPRSPSPHVPARPGGVPNFAAQALTVQLKKTAPVAKQGDHLPTSVPTAKKAPPPPVPPRKDKAARHTGDKPPDAKEEGKEGYLYKRGGIFKGWKKRWFVLKDGKMYYYSSEKTDAPKGVITDIYKVDKLQSKDKDFCFCIYSPKRTYHCHADSSTDLETWLEKISVIVKKETI